MARIPTQIAERRLDTGNVIQYPSGSPLGGAIESFGDELSQAAATLRAKDERKDAFTGDIVENEFLQNMIGMEGEAERSAAADGSGLHDGVYGQMRPEGGVVQPGSFDKLFDGYLERMPASQREQFAAKREAYRMQGSNRLAASQYKREQAWYKVEIQKAQNDIVNSIGLTAPDDQTFEQFRQQGVDLIRKSGLPALEKDVAEANWLAQADETLFTARLERDPEFAKNARAALGLASATGGVTSGSTEDGAAALLRKFEGFRSSTYWDVNAHRLGYGSDTITKADGSVVRVQKGMTVTRADAERDLARRAREFANTAAGQVGRQAWQHLSPNARAALTSVAYNYGSLPDSVVRAVQSGDVGKVASAVAGLAGHNNGINAKRRREEAAVIRGGEISNAGAADPIYGNIPLDRRLILANKADVQVNQNQTRDVAQAKADYAARKDAIELDIVNGNITDEAVINQDGILNDGDKATLIRSVREQNKTVNQVKSDLSALSSGGLALDPYAADDKKRADNLYEKAAGVVSDDQRAALGTAIIEQTGIVPAAILNDLRRGLTSQSIADVERAAQAAQRISTINPAALTRRDGGSEVQQAADDFSYYVNDLNMSPADAASRLKDARDPEKQRDRKALEPAAKEYRKTVEETDIGSLLNESWFAADPALGFNPQQEAGIKADFLAIAENEFFRANGDADLATQRATEQMKRLYGVTELTGRKTIMKHPPEKYWPTSKDGSETMGWGGHLLGSPTSTHDYVKAQLQADLEAIAPGVDMSSVEFVTTPETDREVKRGELPGYAIMWRDANGNYQTLTPGRQWKPDVSRAMQANEDERAREVEAARADSAEERQSIEEMRAVPAFGRDPEPLGGQP